MTTGFTEFDLQASLPAAELAGLHRRIAFLEAAVVQMMREDQQLREWFTASELAALCLPGLPRAASSIARLARREGWQMRISTGRGGERVMFHFIALPRIAFAAFIDRVLRAREAPIGEDGANDLPALAPPPPMPVRAYMSNATPQWVLPLMRLLRGGTPILEDALLELPRRAPKGMACPSPQEARETLRALGMMVG